MFAAGLDESQYGRVEGSKELSCIRQVFGFFFLEFVDNCHTEVGLRDLLLLAELCLPLG